jgi:CRP-like cAMP-binding protein
MERRSFRRFPAVAAQRAAALLPVSGGLAEARIREAAWVARCVGRGHAAPLRPDDVTALAAMLAVRTFRPGSVVFGGRSAAGVWIVRAGRIELSVGSGRSRAIVQLLRPGDVDGDIQLLLEMALPYTGRALNEVTCLFLAPRDFEELLATHPGIARRWLSSVAQRLAASQPGPDPGAAARVACRPGCQPAGGRDGRRAGRTAAADPGRHARGAAAVPKQGAQGLRARRPDPD